AKDYLVYAYLQRGEDDRAVSVAEQALAKERYQPSLISAFHLSVIPARLAVECSNWKRAAALQPRTPAYLPWDDFPWAEGLTWYTRGLGAIHSGDIEAAQEADNRLKRLREKARNNGANDMATYIEIDRRVLAGRIAHARGNAEKAVELTRSATELEAGIEKHPITPGALLPPYEALGHLLMDLNRPAEAFEAYRTSDEIWPGRYKTLLGAARAAKRAGKVEAANEYYEKLLTITGDSKRTTIREARQYISEL
nr:hypothetical protein [Gammaproteobacteria bacterium]NIW99643.1 hypothetical protein [Phycisphaerae bacterium]